MEQRILYYRIDHVKLLYSPAYAAIYWRRARAKTDLFCSIEYLRSRCHMGRTELPASKIPVSTGKGGGVCGELSNGPTIVRSGEVYISWSWSDATPSSELHCPLHVLHSLCTIDVVYYYSGSYYKLPSRYRQLDCIKDSSPVYTCPDQFPHESSYPTAGTSGQPCRLSQRSPCRLHSLDGRSVCRFKIRWRTDGAALEFLVGWSTYSDGGLKECA